MSGICHVLLVVLLLIPTLMEERTKSQIDYAKQLSPHASNNNYSPSQLLKDWPSAELVTDNPKEKFKEYRVGMGPSVSFYSFHENKILGQLRHYPFGVANDHLRKLEERLGKPDTAELTKEDKEDGVMKRYRWSFKDADINVIGSISMQNNTPTYSVTVINRTNYAEATKGSP
ncbi:MAG: hypothetical protein U0796_12680 [Gemmatales bacterium]